MKKEEYKKAVSLIHNVRYGGLPTHYPSLLSWNKTDNLSEISKLWEEYFLRDSKEPFSVYIHIPFCATKCRFCFLQINSKKNVPDEYLDALIAELVYFKKLGSIRKKTDSVYIGGGTPNLMTAAQIKKLGEALKANLNLSSCRQIIMESNPGFWDDEKIEEALKMGVNAVISGVQSFDENISNLNNRTQNMDNFFNIINKFKNNGVLVNIDMLLGLSDSRENFLRDLKLLAKTYPHQVHLNRMKPLKENQISIDKSRLKDMQNRAFSFLEKIGYKRIDEDSASLFGGKNINIQGNPSYQIYSTILGLGSSAMGHIFGKLRYRNEKDYKKYCLKASCGILCSEISEKISEKQEIIHYCLNKLSDGKISMSELKNIFSEKAAVYALKKLNKAVSLKLALKRNGDYYTAGETDFFALTVLFYEKKYLKKVAKIKI
ncbi:MAG: radical SAM protein [Elusimicrobiota bacterium]